MRDLLHCPDCHGFHPFRAFGASFSVRAQPNGPLFYTFCTFCAQIPRPRHESRRTSLHSPPFTLTRAFPPSARARSICILAENTLRQTLSHTPFLFVGPYLRPQIASSRAHFDPARHVFCHARHALPQRPSRYKDRARPTHPNAQNDAKTSEFHHARYASLSHTTRRADI